MLEKRQLRQGGPGQQGGPRSSLWLLSTAGEQLSPRLLWQEDVLRQRAQGGGGRSSAMGPSEADPKDCPEPTQESLRAGHRRIKLFPGIFTASQQKAAEKAMAPRSSTLAWKIPWMESDTTEQLHFHFHSSLSCIGEGNGNPLRVLVWRIPGTGEPGGLPSMGSHRVRHD